MNEFKFSCPHCQQNIQATPEYVGAQINCPSCQAEIIVPQAPDSGAQPGAPKQSKLTKSPSTVQHAATSPVMAATIVRKAKKPRIGLYVGIGVGALAVVAGILFAPKLMDKYHEHQETVLAEEKATNAPPPPPPDPSADEIIKKVAAAYKDLPSFSAQGESVGDLDMSAVNPAFKEPIHTTTKLSILLGRGGHYRIEWDRQAGPKNFKGSTWSSGKGDFVRSGPSSTKVKNREAAMTMAQASSGALGISIAELFFNSTNSLAVTLKNYSKTNNEALNGRKCYVLTGGLGPENVLLWVHKDDFLIAQLGMIMGGKVDDSMLAGLNPTQKAQAKIMEKIKGHVVETYGDIETNRTLAPEDFQKESAPTGNVSRKAPGQPKRAKPQPQ